MSYSFNVRAGTKGEAQQGVSDKLDGVVRAQEVHKADRDVAERAASDAIDLLGELPKGDTDERTHDYSCTVTGAIGTSGDDVTSVNVSVIASILPRT